MTAPSIDLPTGQRARLTGIGLICLAGACFSFLDTTAKYLTAELPILEIVWGRYFFHFVFSLLLLRPWSEPGAWPPRRPGLQAMRGLLLVTLTFANFFALRYLQLDQTVSIGFSAPFLVAILAGPMLGEWVDSKRLLAVMVGFVGVLFVVQPSLDLHPAVLVALTGAFFNSFYSLVTRVLAAYDTSKTTLFVTGIVGVAASTPFVFFVWQSPTLTQWCLLALAGSFGAGGHFLLILAHHYAPASVIAPFNYAQLLWMSSLGFLVFGTLPSSTTLLGAAIMIAAGIYLISRERRTSIPDTPNIE